MCESKMKENVKVFSHVCSSSGGVHPKNVDFLPFKPGKVSTCACGHVSINLMKICVCVNSKGGEICTREHGSID